MAARTGFLLAVSTWLSRHRRRWRRRHLRSLRGGAPPRAAPSAWSRADTDAAAEPRAATHLRVVNASRDS